jgi:hypothetical protein
VADAFKLLKMFVKGKGAFQFVFDISGAGDGNTVFSVPPLDQIFFYVNT